MFRLLAILLLLLAPLSVHAQAVNINTADAAALARELKGIGPAKAEAIVQYRKEHGPFRSIDELALVKGIGPKALDKNRALIRIDTLRKVPSPASPPAVPAKPPATRAAR